MSMGIFIGHVAPGNSDSMAHLAVLLRFWYSRWSVHRISVITDVRADGML